MQLCCYPVHHSPTCNSLTLTLNFNFRALRGKIVVVGNTCMVPSRRRLGSPEMKRSQPRISTGNYSPSVRLRVHIKVAQLSNFDNGQSCVVTVLPEQTSQLPGTHPSPSTAPNAGRLVHTNHHWTGKCTAVLISCYTGWC